MAAGWYKKSKDVTPPTRFPHAIEMVSRRRSWAPRKSSSNVNDRAQLPDASALMTSPDSLPRVTANSYFPASLRSNPDDPWRKTSPLHVDAGVLDTTTVDPTSTVDGLTDMARRTFDAIAGSEGAAVPAGARSRTVT